MKLIFKQILILFIFLNYLNIFPNKLFVKMGGYIPINLSLNVETNIYQYTGDKNQDIYTSVNYLLSIEYKKYLLSIFNKKFEIGLGIYYEGEPRSQKDFKGIGFSYIPVYVILSSEFYQNNDFLLYSSLNIGYNFLNITNVDNEYWDESNGGLYLNFGSGIIDKSNFLIEINYSLSSSSFKEYSYNSNIYIKNKYFYSKISILIGKKFTL